MRIVGIVGHSGSGKTTLIERLIPALVALGLRVATVKHTHHDVVVDDPADPARLFVAAGAREVALVGRSRWALMREHVHEPEPELEALVERFGGVDLILVEGFKRHRHPKIEVHRVAAGTAPLYPDDPDVVALVTDAAGGASSLPCFALDDAAGVARFVVGRFAGAQPAGARA